MPAACLSQPAAASAELVFLIGRPDLLSDRAAAMVAHFEAGNDGTASYYRDQVAHNVRNMAPEARNAWVDKSVAAAQFMLSIKAAGRHCPMEALDPDKVRALRPPRKPPSPWPSRWARAPRKASTVRASASCPSTTSASTDQPSATPAAHVCGCG